VALAPDGKVLAALRDGTVFVWETSSGKELRRLRTSLPVTGPLAFSADGQTLMLVGPEGAVEAWSVATGQKTRGAAQPARLGGFIQLSGGHGALSPDGKLLARQHVDPQNATFTVQVRDLATGKDLWEVNAGTPVFGLCFTPDGKALAWATVTGEVHLWDVAKNKDLGQLGEAAPGGRNDSFAFAPDGKLLALHRADGVIQLWDVAERKKLRQIGEPAAPTQPVKFVVALGNSPRQMNLAFSPDGKALATGCNGAGIRVFEVATGKELGPQGEGHAAAVTSLAVSRNGRTLTTRARGDALRQWDLATGKLVREVRVPENATCAALAPDASLLAAGEGSAVALYDTTTGQKLRQLDGEQMGISALAFAPDGKTLAVRGSQPRAMRLWDVATGKALRILQDEANAAAANAVVYNNVAGALTAEMAFSPDGRFLAAAGEKNQLGLWDTTTGTRLREFQLGGAQAVKRFAFSADGRSLAAVNQDGTVTLFETATGARRTPLGKAVANPGRGASMVVFMGGFIDLFGKGQEAPFSVAYSPDGRLLAAAGPEPAVRVWDALTGKVLGRFQGHQGGVVSLTFAADGKKLISGSLDTTAVVWDLTGPAASARPQKNLEVAAEMLWADLAHKDGARAFEAIRTLCAAPAAAVPLLRERLRPADPPEREQVARLLAELDSKSFAARQKATLELEKLGERAEAGLRQALEGKPSLEMRQRIEQVLRRVSGKILDGDAVRNLRAVEVLEHVGSPEARQVLQALALGAPGARLTREAQGALARLARQAQPAN
jgi:WD40 repeat protein